MGLTQTALAEQSGISPSYLNLIEHNRRAVAGRVLVALAQVLGTSPSELSEDADEALIADLRQAAAVGAGDGAELALIDDLIGRMPGWARLVAALYRQTRDQDAAIAALSDRLTHDPFLGESVHAMLSTITAIRSSAAILTQMEDIPAAQQHRFLTAIHDESVRLSSVAEALATYFDRSAVAQGRAATPEEAADRFLARLDHQFPTLDALGEIAVTPDVAETAMQADVQAAIEDLLDSDPDELDTAARARLRRHLELYAADARAMPLTRFADTARAMRYDATRLATVLRQDLHAVFRRLATLRRPGVDAPQMGLVVVTASGYPLYRAPLPSFPVPRHGNACTLWPLFQAFATPERPLLALLEHDNASRFVALAVALKRAEPALGAPPEYVSAMLVVPQAVSPFPEPGGAAQPIGTSCRICTRDACAARSEPRLLT